MIRVLLSFVVGRVAAQIGTDWMASFSKQKVTDLWILPGTHHSSFFGAYNALDTLFLPWMMCQSEPLDVQLNNGIRFLDLRLASIKGDSDDLKMEDVFDAHSALGTLSLEDTMDTVKAFLEERKTEFVVIFIRLDHAFQSTISLSTVARLFNEYSLKHPDLIHEAGVHQGLGETTVGDVAGKVILISDHRIPRCSDNGQCKKDDSHFYSFTHSNNHPQLAYEESAIRGKMLHFWNSSVKHKNKLRVLKKFVVNREGTMPKEFDEPPSLTERIYTYMFGEADESDDKQALVEPDATTTGGINIDNPPLLGFPMFVVNPLQNDYFLRVLKAVLYDEEKANHKKLGVILFDFPDRKLLHALLELAKQHAQSST